MSLAALADAPPAIWRGLKAVLTDIDDTLTLHGRLPPPAFTALDRLRRAGLRVIPITGRPAGWCDMIARQFPVDGIVGENGAFYFRYDHAAKKMTRVYTQSPDLRRANRAKLDAIASRILRDFPGTAIAGDQAYREIDVAIDFCEDVPALPLTTAQAIADAFIAEGAQAKVSSIHVNAWFGAHDKLTTSKRFLAEALGIDAETAREAIAYCGDSPNDAPMFGYFPLSVGMANVRPYLPLMKSHPAYATKAEGGEGFAEFAAAVLKARHAARRRRGSAPE